MTSSANEGFNRRWPQPGRQDSERPLAGPSTSQWLSLAQARAAGLTDGQWRARRLERVTQSVHSFGPLTELSDRARAYAAVLPVDAAYSHVTAAQLFGLPLPDALAATTDLHVIRPTAVGRSVRSG